RTPLAHGDPPRLRARQLGRQGVERYLAQREEAPVEREDERAVYEIRRRRAFDRRKPKQDARRRHEQRSPEQKRHPPAVQRNQAPAASVGPGGVAPHADQGVGDRVEEPPEGEDDPHQTDGYEDGPARSRGAVEGEAPRGDDLA